MTEISPFRASGTGKSAFQDVHATGDADNDVDYRRTPRTSAPAGRRGRHRAGNLL